MTIDITGIHPSSIRSGEKRPTDEAAQKTVPHDKGKEQETKKTVQLTDRSNALEKLQKAVSNLPDVDTQKVESLKNAIREGRFEVNAERIADKIISMHYGEKSE